MKRNVIIVITAILMLGQASCFSIKTSPELVNAVTKKVESKDFSIVFSRAIPQRMQSVILTSEYYLRIKNDSAFANLPYFGIAHMTPLNETEGGIKFEEPIQNYTIKIKKETGWNIHFTVKAKNKQYNLYLVVFNNGNATLSTSSYDRDMISYDGKMTLP